ncbi:MAG: hypothetical protein QOH68_2892 [Nocardioidaceae bacterium]|jgi:hypothetical protein|nr:hypothetical protein [Nocardioidaceae bacterium]
MFIFLIALLVIATGAALVVLVPQDGYGTRPAPRSHLDSFPPNSFV